MSFHVGQQVVCVNDKQSWRNRIFALIHPPPGGTVRKGEIYTISNKYWSGCHMVELFEVASPENAYWLAGFRADAFRPVVRKTTDISIFTKMLAPTPKEKVSA